MTHDRPTTLSSLSALTVIVADTSDKDTLKEYGAKDATTNPSLVLAAVGSGSGATVLTDTVRRTVKEYKGDDAVRQARLRLCVAFGLELLKVVPGRVSSTLHPPQPSPSRSK
jgi:transaldolase